MKLLEKRAWDLFIGWVQFPSLGRYPYNQIIYYLIRKEWLSVNDPVTKSRVKVGALELKKSKQDMVANYVYQWQQIFSLKSDYDHVKKSTINV